MAKSKKQVVVIQPVRSEARSNPERVLLAHGIPTDTYIGANHFVRDNITDLPKTNQIVRELTGEEPPFTDEHYQRFFLRYLVQGFVRGYCEGNLEPNTAFVVKRAQQNTIAFFQRVENGDFGNDFRTRDDQPAATPEAVRDQVAKSGEFKKGQKVILAKEIYETIIVKNGGEKKAVMDRFMTELQMSKAGAQTYFHNFKTGKW